MAEKGQHTLYFGNLDDRVDESLLYELGLQAGPVVSVYMPKDRVSLTHQGYGFVEYATAEDAAYAVSLFGNIRLYNKSVNIRHASSEKSSGDVGAKVFVGNLDPLVTDKSLTQTFSTFGPIVSTKISRSEDGQPRGFGFVIFEDFETADAAIANMNGQYLMNKPCTVSYARKENGSGFHGNETERRLAQEAKKHGLRFGQKRNAGQQ